MVFSSFDDFDPIHYVRENYGKRILPEDEELIRTTVLRLPKLIGNKVTRVAADVGAGPNFYTAMILAGLGANQVDLVDYSPANLAFMNALLGSKDRIYRNNQQSIDTHEPWAKFEKLIAEIGGEQFHDTFRRARSISQSERVSIYELPEGKYDIVLSFFVAESITTEEEECVRAFTSLINSLRDGGYFAIAVIVGSEGYSAGVGTHFPAVKLSVEDFRRIFGAIPGVTFEIYPTGQTDEPCREGYHGMAVIIGQFSRIR
jgi:hypothetical protein